MGRSGQLHKLGVLRPPAGEVAGQHSKKSPDDHNERQPVQGEKIGPDRNKIKDQIQDQQENIELVAAVPAVHKALNGIPDHERASSGKREPPIWHVDMIPREMAAVKEPIVNKM